jgi:hypothetical protein
VHGFVFVAQAREEMERLEGRKAEAMRGVMALKRAELDSICAAARMPPPPPPADVAAAEGLRGAAASAQAPSRSLLTCAFMRLSSAMHASTACKVAS